MKAYAIMEVGWEYNDEHWYRPECEGGVPKTVYVNRAEAEDMCERMNDTKILENVKSDHPIIDGDYKPAKIFYELVEVELVK